MKRVLISVVIVSLLFSFMFMGCSEDKGAARLTDEEVSAIAMASFISGKLTMEFAMDPPPDDTYDGSGILSDMIVSGTLIVDGGGTTFTFANCGLDFDEDTDADLTLNGGFSIGGDLATMIVTYSDFSMTGTVPGTTTSINVIVTGTLTMTETEINVEITISGITDNPCTVVIAVSIPEGLDGRANASKSQALFQDSYCPTQL